MSLELPPDERERIRAEEIFRDEVRRELEKQRPKDLRNKIWDFVNTSFGIWLLSSVVLGSLVWSWTLIQEYRHTAKAREERLTKVTYEIYRDYWSFWGYARDCWNYEQYERAFKKTLQNTEYTLSDFKDSTYNQLTWLIGEIPPLRNKERGEKLLRIEESIHNDIIRPLQPLGDLDETKKRAVDQRIKKILREEVGPIVYPDQKDAYVF